MIVICYIKCFILLETSSVHINAPIKPILGIENSTKKIVKNKKIVINVTFQNFQKNKFMDVLLLIYSDFTLFVTTSLRFL